jgi:hypothetical protein
MALARRIITRDQIGLKRNWLGMIFVAACVEGNLEAVRIDFGDE